MRILAAILCCIALANCSESEGPPPNQDQVAYYEKWANRNATDAQIDALIREMPRPVQSWQATITNAREDGDYTIIDTAYRNQIYRLWIFEPAAREKARKFSAKVGVIFSGDIVQELSITRTGAKENPEFGVYASQVIGGGIEIIQTAEGIARQHELDRQAEKKAFAESEAKRRDSAYENKTIEYCKEGVTQKLKIPVGSAFSWFQGKTLKESDIRWTYTDIVTYVTDSGNKASVRFVCTVTINGDSLDRRVKFLK